MKRGMYRRGIWLTALLLISAGMALYWALVAQPKPEIVTGDVVTEALLVATVFIWLWVLLGGEGGLARATAPLVLGVSLFLLGGVSDVLDEFFRLPEFVKSYFENGLILAGTSLIAIGLTRWVTHSRREAEVITRRNRELAALNAIAATVSQSLELDRVLNDALDEVLKLGVFKAEAGAKVFLLDEQRTTLSLAAHRRTPADHPCLRKPVKVGECLCGLAVEQGQVVMSADPREDERHSRRWPDMLPHKDVCVPLKAKGRVLGVLDVSVSADWDVADTEIALLTAIGDQIGVAIENAQLYEERKAQNERISALYRIDQALISSIDLEQTLQLVMKEISTAIGVNRCSLWLLDESGQAVTGMAELQPEAGRVPSITGMKLRLSDEPLLVKVLTEGRPIVVNDVHDPAWARLIKKEHIETFGIKSLLVVPLESKGQRKGLIILDDSRERHLFTPDEVALAVSAARQASIAIENARLFEETKQRLQELAMLYQVSVGVTGTLELDHVLQLIIDSAIQAIPAAEKGSLFLLDEETNELVIRAAHGYSPDVVRRVRLKVDGGHSGWAGMEGLPMIIDDFQTDSRLKDFSHLEEVAAIKSAVVVPLEAKGRVIGILSLDNVTSFGAFSERDLQLLSTFASQAAIAIENARLFAERAQHTAEIERLKEFNECIVQSMEESIIVEDAQGRVTFANPKAMEMLGYTQDEILGQHWSKFVPEREQEKVRQESRKLPQGIKSRYEALVLSKEGQEIPVIVSATPLFEEGEFAGVLSVFTDITEQKQLQAQLLQSAKLSAVGELIAGVAHELNNPLTAIVGYAELVQQAEVNQEIKRDLQRIHHEAVRSARIVRNLLTFARQHKPEKVYVSINDIIERTLELRAYQLRADNIEVVRELDERVPWTMADPHQLQQVFLNIINNARDAMVEAHGRGKLVIKSEVQSPRSKVMGRELEEQRVIRVSITDDGPGIPPEITDRIFDPFFTTKEAGRGTGLGLSICYGIVQEHGGNIYAQSVVGKGTTFVVELPVREEGIARPEALPEEEQREYSTKDILVVDDEQDIVSLLTRCLQAEGHRVDTATDGGVALEKIREKSHDVIILDLRMPGMSGREVYERIREMKPELARRVIFTTGDVISPDTMAFLEEMGNVCLEKPFRLEQVKEAVRRV